MMELLIALFLFLVVMAADECENAIYDDYYDRDVSGLLEED